MSKTLPAALALAIAATTAPVLAQQDQGQAQAPKQERADYLGKLQPLNGSSLRGMVAFKTHEGQMIASLGIADMSPGQHMAHIHGFTGQDPKDAACPTQDEADANGDGLVDLIETEATAGKTLVPLTGNPASLKIKGAEGYPRADADGNVLYLETASIQELEKALKQAHDTPLALDKRVVFVHGLPEGVEVPDSVQSLPGAPAHATLPIACAEIQPKGQMQAQNQDGEQDGQQSAEQGEE